MAFSVCNYSATNYRRRLCYTCDKVLGMLFAQYLYRPSRDDSRNLVQVGDAQVSGNFCGPYGRVLVMTDGRRDSER